MNPYNLVSLCGIFVLLAVAWLLSADKRNMNRRVIAWGLGLQILLGLFVFVLPAGTKIFLLVNQAVVKVLDSAGEGARFVFGPLAIPPGQTGEGGQKSLGFILAFQAFPTIIFFSALVAGLYYLRVMQALIRGFACVFCKLMRLSGAESLAAAGNIFVGVESALTVKPYLPRMTRSEFCTILTCGMATVASNVLVLYVVTLQGVFPTIAGHMVSASLLSAPAALVMSKIILPEAQKPVTLGTSVRPYYERENSFFEAIINGANAGVKMIVGIVALLIAVLGLVALVNLVLTSLGGWINPALGTSGQWSLQAALGYLFYPFTLAMGVPLEDAGVVSEIIGERVVVTEVVSYKDLAAALQAGRLQHQRSAVIATYALCGFAHLASMAIFVGGISALVRQRTTDIAGVAVRALIAATLACLLTGCIAGLLFNEGSILINGN